MAAKIRRLLLAGLFTITFITLLTLGAFMLGMAQADFALAAEMKAAGESEWAKTLAAARKEGKLAVFLYQRENIEAAVKAFEKKFPEIQLTVATTPAAETGPRIMAERRAGKYLWDICICGPTTPYSILYAAKALDPIKPVLMLPEIIDVTKWWDGNHHTLDPVGGQIGKTKG
jgi:ABC-type glycerol-3-phosphate transport system substrate-binding protein